MWRQLRGRPGQGRRHHYLATHDDHLRLTWHEVYDQNRGCSPLSEVVTAVLVLYRALVLDWYNPVLMAGR